MATITFGKTGTRPYGVLTVTETATSISANTSTLSIKLVLKRPYAISSTATKTASCTVNGNTYSWSGSIGGSGDLTLISKTLTVPHNADGTKTIPLSALIDLNITWSGESIGTIRGTETMQLTTLLVQKPEIGTCSYIDENAQAVAITSNNQLIVQNQSDVKFTVTGLKAYNSATIKSCTIKVNGSTINMIVNGSTASQSNINISSSTNVDAVFTVTDSNGLTATKTITVQTVPWYMPNAIITAGRKDNYYTETNIKVDADYSRIGDNTVSISYICAEDSGTLASVSGIIENNVLKTVNLDNNYSWTITITLTDRFGGKVTYKTFVPKGIPILYIDTVKSSVGINCFPQDNKSLEINGINSLMKDSDWQDKTTDTVGNVTLGLNISKYIVSAVWIKDINEQWLIALPFIDQYGNWHTRVFAQSATPSYAINTSVKVRIYYRQIA